MKNGNVVDGKIVNVKNNFERFKTFVSYQDYHNVIFNIEYKIGDEIKEIVVDHFVIDDDVDSYLNKNVKIYFYNNMNYVDILKVNPDL